MTQTRSMHLDHGPAHVDVLVIGGGPGGSTAAALLAERGFSVVLLEKSRHPRFHIGESLLPANLELMERLGVVDEVRAIGMEKWGAEFISPWNARKRQTFEFADAWDKSMPMAYQVRRSEFDHVLLRNAAAKGAQVFEACTASDVQISPAGTGAKIAAVHGDGRTSTWAARYVVDASGRDTFLADKLKTKRRDPRHASASLFAHYRGARRLEGKAEGNITIFWFEHGWLWFIPLADGTTSVGAVVWPYYLKTRKTSLEDFFDKTIAMVPELSARLQNASRITPVSATGNYSYSCSRSQGPGYFLIGDAFAFIDPVFSSGVMLAMQGGFAVADAIETCLRQPHREAQARARFERIMHLGPREFSWFIYRVNHPVMRDLLMAPRNIFRVKEALLSLLAGDIFKSTPIWASLHVLKGIYYFSCLKNFVRSLRARAMRRQQIQL